MTVWILVFYMSRLSNDGGPILIDNIATQQECERIQRVLSETPRVLSNSRCIEVRKTKQ